MLRNLICKKCLSVVGQEETKQTVKPRKVKLCATCKEQSLLLHKEVLKHRNTSTNLREKNSKRMSHSNPMRSEDIRKKVSQTLKEQYQNGSLVSSFQNPEKLKQIKSKWKITDQGRKSISDRMKTNNPMNDPALVQKGKETWKKRVEAGEITFKKGKDHWLWKGNRLFSDTVRCQLFPVWTKLVLERDSYQCQMCGSDRNLHVHHIRPLRSMIAELLVKYAIKRFSDVKSADWQPYIDEIIKMHKIEEGITLCIDCHDSVDEKFHKESFKRKIA